MNQLLELMAAPWALEPRRLLEIQSMCMAQLRGGTSPGSPGLAAGLGGQQTQRQYTIERGVACIPVQGVVMRRPGLLASLFDAASTEAIGRDLQSALANPEVVAVLLEVDSPGGSVDGPHALAAAIHAARPVKPIVALASGMMASAAYLIGSAASQVFIDDVSTMTGSIGVVTNHLDLSKAMEQRGIKATEVTAGRYKRIASEYAPLSTEGRQYMQASVDYHYSLFVNAVAKHRGASVDQVLAQMADGRMFIGRQGVEAGLVDGITSRQALITSLAAKQIPSGANTMRNASPVLPPNATRQQRHQAALEYQASHPGTTYSDAVKAVQLSGVHYGEQSQPSTTYDAQLAGSPRLPAGWRVDPERAQLDASARQYQQAHPGTSYMDAVRAVQLAGR